MSVLLVFPLSSSASTVIIQVPPRPVQGLGVKEKGNDTVPLLLLVASGQRGVSSRVSGLGSGTSLGLKVTRALAMSPCGSSN